jgi:hypothetical protein
MLSQTRGRLARGQFRGWPARGIHLTLHTRLSQDLVNILLQASPQLSQISLRVYLSLSESVCLCLCLCLSISLARCLSLSCSDFSSLPPSLPISCYAQLVSDSKSAHDGRKGAGWSK